MGGGSRPSYRESSGPTAAKVSTASLYQAQLADAATIRDYGWTSGSGNWTDVQKWNKFAVPAVRTVQSRDYLIGDIDSLTYDGSANTDDNYYIDAAFKSQMQAKYGSNVGGFDVVSTDRNLAFTQLYTLDAGEQVVNASLAMALRPAGGAWANDVMWIDGVGETPLSSLTWSPSRAVGTTSMGVVDLGRSLSALNGGKLNVAVSSNTGADYALLSLTVAKATADAQGANVTLSGGGAITVDSAVPAVGNVAVNGLNTTLEIANGAQLAVRNLVVSQGALHIATGSNPGQLTVQEGVVLQGTYQCDINGSPARTGYSQLVVDGTVALGGLLTVNKAAGFTPDATSDMFWVVLNDGVDPIGGAFSNYTNDTTVFMTGARAWHIYYGADALAGTLSGGNDVVIAAAAATWTGGANSAWSTTAGSGNWKLSGGAAASYSNGAAVTFDDTAAGSTADISVADVTPASVVFNNASKNFTITGTKGIAGTATTVKKQGAGTVTMGSVNTYGGLTTVEGGKLILQGAAKAMAPVLNNGGADIKAGMLVLDYAGEADPVAAIKILLTTSYLGSNGIRFNIGKFLCSTADSSHGLGWVDNTMTSKISVAYTLYGDTNLDGTANFTDLSKLLSTYNKSGVWADGDTNYDGAVDFADLSKLLSTYNQSIGTLTPAPEPSSIFMLTTMVGLAGAWMIRPNRPLNCLLVWPPNGRFYQNRKDMGAAVQLPHPVATLSTGHTTWQISLATREGIFWPAVEVVTPSKN